MKTLVLLVASTFAVVLLGTLSKYIYDVLRDKGWLPNSPSLTRIVIVVFCCIGLAVTVILPNLFKKEQNKLVVHVDRSSEEKQIRNVNHVSAYWNSNYASLFFSEESAAKKVKDLHVSLRFENTSNCALKDVRIQPFVRMLSNASGETMNPYALYGDRQAYTMGSKDKTLLKSGESILLDVISDLNMDPQTKDEMLAKVLFSDPKFNYGVRIANDRVKNFSDYEDYFIYPPLQNATILLKTIGKYTFTGATGFYIKWVVSYKCESNMYMHLYQGGLFYPVTKVALYSSREGETYNATDKAVYDYIVKVPFSKVSSISDNSWDTFVLDENIEFTNPDVSMKAVKARYMVIKITPLKQGESSNPSGVGTLASIRNEILQNADAIHWESVSENYERLIYDSTKTIEQRKNKAAPCIERAFGYIKKEQYDNAIQDLNKAIELESHNAIAYSYRGGVYYKKGQYEQAIRDMTKAIELEPNSSSNYSNRGAAYSALGQYERAMKDYNKCIALDPDNADVYFNRGNEYSKRGEYEQAIRDFSRVIDTEPYNSNAYNNRGAVYFKTGNYDKAIQDFTKAIELRPDDVTAYDMRNLARILKQQKK